MSETATVLPERAEQSPRRRWARLGARLDLPNTMGWLGAYVLVTLIVGALAGTVWYWAVDLPGYTLDNSFFATMSELAHSQIFAADAWLSGLGVLAGIGLGWLAWRWFGRLGWPCAVIAPLAGLLAGFSCSFVGSLLGPDDFDVRLANAQPSATPVAVELASHTPVYLAVWAAAALLPILAGTVVAPLFHRAKRWQHLEP
ncbi:MAG: hypothetical protein LBR33_04705 [Propionibacteriaceae bacterium]|jgi:hypothetical protein|nr:hypothetical protein [Propionibacteriaceae bacterium]